MRSCCALRNVILGIRRVFGEDSITHERAFEYRNGRVPLSHRAFGGLCMKINLDSHDSAELTFGFILYYIAYGYP